MYSSAGDLRENYSGKITVIDKIGRLLRKPLIDGYSEEDWAFMEGSAMNLKLDQVKVPDMSEDQVCYIGPDERFTAKTIVLEPHEYELRGKTRFGWVLAPGSSVLLVSTEVTNVPLNCFMPVKSRFSFAACFNNMACSDAHPNFQNRITTMLTVGPLPLALGKGCDFVFVRLAHLTDDNSDAYAGVWQQDGGFTSTTNGEAVRAK